MQFNAFLRRLSIFRSIEAHDSQLEVYFSEKENILTRFPEIALYTKFQ